MTTTRVAMKRIVQVWLGLCVGLLLVEAVFWWRDDGAFPHVNFYVPDGKLGVRLQPDATERFRLGKNPLSHISVNSDGLRGAELPAPSAEGILVLGDSQVFGLGVHDHETFSYALSKLMRRPVVNGGVPTYGPLEYNALAAELIAQRKPGVVIYTVNMLNDLFENDRPNTSRHRVWDGWAVRAETAPKDTLEFPGRTWLFSQSHAVYALRRYLHDPSTEAPSYASEGAWTDLVGIGQRRAQSVAQRDADAMRLNDEITKSNADLDQAVGALWQSPTYGREHELRSIASAKEPFARAQPGDILRDGDAESSRAITVTAEIIQAAAEARRNALQELAVVEEKNRVLLAAAVKTHDELKQRRRALIARYRRPPQTTSVLDQRLRELRKLCDDNGCDVLVIALPIDVQVSAEEWRKYGRKPLDMSATTALADDLLSTARRLGMRTLDALPALKRAEPGAFLDADIHMTAKGHATLAKAIVGALNEPAPTRQPDPGIPAGRTYPPNVDDLPFASDVPIDYATGTECHGLTQDEWVAIRCEGDGDSPLRPLLTFAKAIEGGHGEMFVSIDDYAITVMAPLLPHEELKIDFEWKRSGAAPNARRENATLIATRGAVSDVPVLKFTPRTRSAFDTDATARSWLSPSDNEYDWMRPTNRRRSYAPDRPDCEDPQGTISYHCVTGDPAHWPSCPRGSINGNAFGRCLPLCKGNGPKRGCDSGICEAWQGIDVCRPRP